MGRKQPNPEPGTVFGHWRFIRRTDRPVHATSKATCVWWLLECTKCHMEHVRVKNTVVSGASTQCQACKNRAMPHTKNHLWNWFAIKNMRSRGHSWREITTKHGHGCVQSALVHASHSQELNLWDYSRAFKAPSYFICVKALLDQGLSWAAIYKQTSSRFFKNYIILMQQFNKELYRKTHKEATTYIHSHAVQVRFLTGAGWSAAKIAEHIRLTERNVVRWRSTTVPPVPSLATVRTLVRDLRNIQLEDMGWKHSKNLLLGLFPQIPDNARKPEIRAWVDVLDMFEEELVEILGG